ncbi:hypothetical protein EROM_081700 [Encephalitozoon romaleae SJ-2008]|uniref:Ricin B lectin n=1 Tax=Encephalitozoon romaleae (strain SJ-2008) TaxID=1178016 RepID=I6ZV11_ENCRO|nr:hypothetical protein EROM_081700 [Encephalitozoon romaleae SJ-2008]AFN83586.1 hypothetical protein EROM_081700 [Encephalitozoon romaleae SJ-2008]
MKKAMMIFQLMEAISGLSIFAKGGVKKYITKGGRWRSPDYGINYQLAAMSTSGTPTEFRSEELSPGIKILKEVGTSDVLDLHHPKSGQTKLIFHSRNNGLTQKFGIEGNENDGYTLKNKNKDLCLEYDDDGNIYGTTCSENSRQKFDVVYTPEDPEYKPPSEEAMDAPSIGSPSPQGTPQIFIFNESPENNHGSKHKHRRGHSHKHHHHHHHSPHESPYFTYQKYSDQIIV